MITCNLHIKDIKEISSFSKEIFDIDFNHLAYVTLKIRIEQFCKKYKIISPQLLRDKIESSSQLKKEYLSFVFFNEFELFRDPALWRCLKDNVLSQISNELSYRVLFPSCQQGAELVSFLILREELGLVDKIQVMYTSQHSYLNQVAKGFDYEERKHHLNLSNYKRIDGQDLPDTYFSISNNKLIPNPNLYKNTSYFSYNETRSPFKKSVNLIVYRNKLLNYNRNFQIEVTNNLIKTIKPGGYLVLGVKERLIDDVNRELFTIFNIKESVYKKKSNVI